MKALSDWSSGGPPLVPDLARDLVERMYDWRAGIAEPMFSAIRKPGHPARGLEEMSCQVEAVRFLRAAQLEGLATAAAIADLQRYFREGKAQRPISRDTLRGWLKDPRFGDVTGNEFPFDMMRKTIIEIGRIWTTRYSRHARRRRTNQ